MQTTAYDSFDSLEAPTRSELERWGALVTAGALIGYGLTRRSLAGLCFAAGAAPLAYRGFTGRLARWAARPHRPRRRHPRRPRRRQGHQRARIDPPREPGRRGVPVLEAAREPAAVHDQRPERHRQGRRPLALGRARPGRHPRRVGRRDHQRDPEQADCLALAAGRRRRQRRVGHLRTGASGSRHAGHRLAAVRAAGREDRIAPSPCSSAASRRRPSARTCGASSRCSRRARSHAPCRSARPRCRRRAASKPSGRGGRDEGRVLLRQGGHPGRARARPADPQPARRHREGHGDRDLRLRPPHLRRLHPDHGAGRHPRPRVHGRGRRSRPRATNG